VADLAVDLGGGGGVPATAYYHTAGCTNDTDWTSLTWAGVHTIMTLVDIASNGITRVGSIWTFANPGRYSVAIEANKGTTTPEVLGFRARLSGATIDKTKQGQTDSNTVLAFLTYMMQITVSAGSAVTLEYCLSAAGAGTPGAAVTLNGEQAYSGKISIFRIGT
jgi:hypothetical protein